MQHTYSGPHFPMVRNAWLGLNYLWHQYLADKGYISRWCECSCDVFILSALCARKSYD
jgi:hypothetical protein